VYVIYGHSVLFIKVRKRFKSNARQRLITCWNIQFEIFSYLTLPPAARDAEKLAYCLYCFSECLLAQRLSNCGTQTGLCTVEKWLTVIFFINFTFNFHSSPNIISVLKLRRIRWMEHVAHMAARRNYIQNLCVKPRRKEYSK